jgi:hypothetical protein
MASISQVQVIDRNALGERGEAILKVLLLTPHGGAPLFRLAHLGEKWPTVDYLVELVGKPGNFLFLQVKTTQDGVQKNGRLRVGVDKEKYNDLALFRIPKYIVGVNSETEDAYICAVTRSTDRKLSSLVTSHSLKKKGIRRLLFREVARFWKDLGGRRFRFSALSDK